MNNCMNCNTCKHCWRDDSVGDRECLRADEMTEEQLEKYYADLNDNCPLYEEDENYLDDDYLLSLQ